MQKKFYVYFHRTADSGHVFYVGKGSRHRAWSKVNRSAEWRKIASRGYVVEIAKSDMTEICAYILERILISIAPEGSLCNIALGGPGGGMHGKSHSQEARLKMSAAGRGKAKSDAARRNMAKGIKAAWACPDYRDKHAEAIRKKEIHRFHHPDHGTIFCTQYEIGKRFNFSRGAATSLINGAYKSYRGWRLEA